MDRFVSEIKPDVINGVPVIIYKLKAVAPQATEHDILFEFAPSIDPNTGEKKPTFYINRGE